MAAIEIQGLEKSYKTGFFGNKLKQGLKPLTLSVEEGEVFGCLGPNGAGKDHDAEAAAGAGVSQRRHGAEFWAAPLDDIERQALHRLSAGATVFLRPPDRRWSCWTTTPG